MGYVDIRKGHYQVLGLTIRTHAENFPHVVLLTAVSENDSGQRASPAPRRGSQRNVTKKFNQRCVERLAAMLRLTGPVQQQTQSIDLGIFMYALLIINCVPAKPNKVFSLTHFPELTHLLNVLKLLIFLSLFSFFYFAKRSSGSFGQ